jgi:peroxiredoxin Q/BCP
MRIPALLVALLPAQVVPVPKVGDAAPSFAIPDQDGRLVTGESLRGRKVVLAFYPKDFTPG